MASTKTETEFFKFSVSFETRKDGGLMVYSEDVPGFVLSGKEQKDVLSDIIPSLQFILSKLYNAQVIVEPLKDLRSMLIKNGVMAANEPRPPIGGRQEYVVTSYERQAISA